MKNRKLLTAGLGVGISSIVLLTNAYTVMADTSSGYDLYKSAIKQTHATKSITADVNVSLTDNGKELLAVQGKVKNEEAANLGSGSMNIKANGAAHTVQFYRQADQVVLKTDDSDSYKVIKPDANEQHQWKQHHNANDDGTHPGAEKVIDALMTNLQNDIQVTQASGGGKEVSLHLTQQQISPVVQALASVVLQHAANHHELATDGGQDELERHAPQFAQDLKPELPKLTQDIVVKQVDVKAEITQDNYVGQQEATLTVSGKDDSGASHEMVLTVHTDLSNVGDTKADTIDLTGKKVETIQKR